jgi:hypothetical protein
LTRHHTPGWWHLQREGKQARVTSLDEQAREHFDLDVMICTLRKIMKFRESFGKLFLGTPWMIINNRIVTLNICLFRLPNEIQFNVFIHFFPNLNRCSVQFKCNTLEEQILKMIFWEVRFWISSKGKFKKN